ncbi:hypothetical protein M1D96_16890 [Pseudomonas sp. D1-3]|uniref:hypothetical protein n=1 Tax=Phytopseudomonas argentinensis TaxID=289370 RepID=UPI0008A842C8|nr:hypothetical protein [Pseudomonas argentinensis]
MIWKPGVLPVEARWRRDGPDLPIDFARESDGGELATVICSTAPVTRVMWSLMRSDSMACARELLRQREKIPSSQPWSVGSVAQGTLDPQLPHARSIAAWARAQGLDGVVWTALPPRFQGENGRIPSIEEALQYLQALPEQRRRHAEHYVCATPRFVATALRETLERQLGWTPGPCAAPLLRARQGPPRPGTSRRRSPTVGA